jgi:hypothetical protein
MIISTTQLLEILSKVQKLNIATEITEVDGDFFVDFSPDLYGRRDQTDSIIITNEGIWRGYGWTFERFMSVLDERLQLQK